MKYLEETILLVAISWMVIFLFCWNILYGFLVKDLWVICIPILLLVILIISFSKKTKKN